MRNLIFPVIFLLFVEALVSCSQLPKKPAVENLVVTGEVKDTLTLSPEDIRDLPSFEIRAVTLVKEKSDPKTPDERIATVDLKGVLLRDILFKAGLKHTRKWEPAVVIRVKGKAGDEAVFSFGEIFYSSIGRSVLLSYEKDGKALGSSAGCGTLVIATDLRAGRTVNAVAEIVVERKDVEMLAYKDKKDGLMRPAEPFFTINDHASGKALKVQPTDLEKLRRVPIEQSLHVGDCEGFHGLFAFEGVLLRDVVSLIGVAASPADYKRYVLVKSRDGFCASFSMGELYNSRLGDNVIVAMKKLGRPLDPDEGFAMTAVREDSTGGRSVKRIYEIDVF
ncbi:MAG: molybdopterin-dependent oxidoreductase [Deltaproteobacteria bacterium]|nr:molybdopterin-dependent oxidoreductase [Deltaproteobacteria bacterium]